MYANPVNLGGYIRKVSLIFGVFNIKEMYEFDFLSFTFCLLVKFCPLIRSFDTYYSVIRFLFIRSSGFGLMALPCPLLEFPWQVPTAHNLLVATLT